MSFFVIDPLTSKRFEFKDRVLADAKASELYALMVERNSEPFQIFKEVVDGNSTTWTFADLENDPENGVYYVYNPFMKDRDRRNSLSEAKAWLADVKNAYMSLNLTFPAVVDKGNAK